MNQEKTLIWIREPLLLLEIEKGAAWVRTEKYECTDYVPAVESRLPRFILHIFSDPDEYGERKTISVALAQSNTEVIMDAIAEEIERFAKVKDGAEKELAEIKQ